MFIPKYPTMSLLEPYFNGKLNEVLKNQNSHGELEIEARIRLDNRSAGHDMTRTVHGPSEVIAMGKSLVQHLLESGTAEVSHSINYISEHKTADGGMRILQKYYDGDKPRSGRTWYTKRRLVREVNLGIIVTAADMPFKLDAQVEEPIEPFDKKHINLARVRKRISIRHPNLPGWLIEITLTNTVSAHFSRLMPQLNQSVIPSMFGDYEVAFTDSSAWHHADKIEIELEWQGKSTPATKAISQGPLYLITQLTGTESSGDNKREYQAAVYDIANAILPPRRAQAFKMSKSLKSLGPSVVDLGRNYFYRDLRFEMPKFSITYKADGVRSMIIASKSGRIRLIGADFVELQSAKPTFSRSVESAKAANLAIPEDPVIWVLEGELLGDVFLIFDCLVHGGKSICKEPLNNRLDIAKNYIPDVPKSKSIGIKQVLMKKFIYLTEDWPKEVEQFYRKKPDFPIDGWVFTEINADYNSTKIYKWKPPSHLSVDFYVLPAGRKDDFLKEGTRIWLCTGITREMFSAQRLKLPLEWSREYSALPEYFPVPFSSSFHAAAYDYTLTKEDVKILLQDLPKDARLRKNVIEMGFLPGDEIVPFRMRVMRVRTDRAKELATGGYFGNDYRIAELNLQSVMNPLQISDFRPIEDSEQPSRSPHEPTSEQQGNNAAGYFRTVNNTRWRAIRSWNNQIKDYVFRTYMRSKNQSVLDLAAGRAQDLTRYYKLGVNHLIMTDIDSNAISEIITRKYWLLKESRKGDNYKTNLRVATVDLNSAGAINELGKLGVNKNNTMVVCNMAIHYMSESDNQCKNFVSLVDFSSVRGGMFVFSCFDGQRVWDLLRQNNGVWSDSYDESGRPNGMYHIELVNDTNTAMPAKMPDWGTRIRLRLPFTGEALYEEPLVKITSLNNILSKRFIKTVEIPFCDNDLSIKPKTPLKEADKIFSGLYSYFIYTKK